MKKTKKLLTLTTAIICLLLLLSSCGNRSSRNQEPRERNSPPPASHEGGPWLPPSAQNSGTQQIPSPRTALPISTPTPPLPLGEREQLSFTWVVPPVYNRIEPFRGGAARVHITGLPVRLVNESGEIPDIPNFILINGFYNGTATAVTAENDVVIINTGGEIIYTFPPGVSLQRDREAREHIVVSRLNSVDDTVQTAVYDRAGYRVIPFTNRDIRYVSEGMVVYRIRNTTGRQPQWLYGLMDMEENIILEPQFFAIQPFFQGIAPVRPAELWQSTALYLIDTAGNFISEQRFHTIRPINNGLIANRRRAGMDGFEPNNPNNSGFINSLGELVIPYDFMNIYNFSDGLAAVRIGYWVTTEPVDSYYTIFWGSHWGFIDGTGRVVTNTEFYEVRCFSNGMAAVAVRDAEDNLLWTYINTAGEMIAPPQYCWVGDFSDGFAVVNKGGTIVHEERLRILDYGAGRMDGFGFSNHYEAIGGEFMLIDRWGRVAMTLDGFDSVGELSEGILPVNQGRQIAEDGLWGFIYLFKMG
jgi:hypothetical protein